MMSSKSANVLNASRVSVVSNRSNPNIRDLVKNSINASVILSPQQEDGFDKTSISYLQDNDQSIVNIDTSNEMAGRGPKENDLFKNNCQLMTEIS